MKRLMLSLTLALVLSASARAQERAGAVHLEEDVVYAKVGDAELKLDIGMPKQGNGPFPAVVCVHGGGWQAGSYKHLTQTVKFLAGRGYVAVSVQYRFAPKHPFPAQVEDCKAAVRWLRANAAKYKVDKDRIGAFGMSAGAHLVCMLGLTTAEDGLEGQGGNLKESSRVQAVVSVFGPTDFTKGDWETNVEPLITDFLGGKLQDKPGVYKQASPVTYVRKDPAPPPFLFFHGDKDVIVRIRHSELLVDALKQAGGQAALVRMAGEGHGWAGEKLQQSINQMADFFDKQLKK